MGEQVDVLGYRIRQHRVARNWSQRELGNRVGTSEAVVSRWENNRNRPDKYRLARLAEVFNVPVSVLTGEPAGEPDAVERLREDVALFREQTEQMLEEVLRRLEGDGRSRRASSQ